MYVCIWMKNAAGSTSKESETIEQLTHMDQ